MQLSVEVIDFEIRGLDSCLFPPTTFEFRESMLQDNCVLHAVARDLMLQEDLSWTLSPCLQLQHLVHPPHMRPGIKPQEKSTEHMLLLSIYDRFQWKCYSPKSTISRNSHFSLHIQMGARQAEGLEPRSQPRALGVGPQAIRMLVSPIFSCCFHLFWNRMCPRFEIGLRRISISDFKSDKSFFKTFDLRSHVYLRHRFD